jgi:hypothetical protein
MFEELHGPIAVHNGHAVLANSDRDQTLNVSNVNEKTNSPVSHNGSAIDSSIRRSNSSFSYKQVTASEDVNFRPTNRDGNESIYENVGGDGVFPKARTGYMHCSRSISDIHANFVKGLWRSEVKMHAAV